MLCKRSDGALVEADGKPTVNALTFSAIFKGVYHSPDLSHLFKKVVQRSYVGT